MQDLHPFVVHFPIALLTTAFIVDLVGHFARKPALLQSGWLMQIVGTVGLLLAIATGVIAEPSTLSAPEAREHLDIHKELAFVFTAVFLLLLFWRVRGRSILPRKRELLFLACYGLAIVAMWVGAWYGGELVYTYRLGMMVTGLTHFWTVH